MTESSHNVYLSPQSILPETNETVDLGAIGRRWRNIFAKNFTVDTFTATSLTGNTVTAATALVLPFITSGQYLKTSTGGTIVGQATPIPVADGGTGAATITGLLLGHGTSAVTAYGGTGNGPANQFVTKLDANGAATWAAASGGGGGTVTNNEGNLTLNHLVIGGGGSDIQDAGALSGYVKANGASAPTASATVPATDLSGTLAAAQFPALSGDVTTSAGSLATTLANSGVSAGTYGQVTVDAKGRVTAGVANDVAHGGTGLTSGTSGGVLAFTGATTIVSSAALTASAIVLGGGAGAAPTVLGSLGTTTTVLHGNAGGAPTFAGVSIADHTATGTPSSTTFLRGDNTWSTPASSGVTGSSTTGWSTYWSGATSIAGDQSHFVVQALTRASIQAAHDALPAAGGTVVLPAGTYVIDSTTITVIKPVRFVGAGKENTIFLIPAGNTNDVFTVNNSEVSFEGLTIASATVRATGAGINVGVSGSCDRTTVWNCNIHTQAIGVHFTNGGRASVADTMFDSNGVGVQIDAGFDTRILDNFFISGSTQFSHISLLGGGGLMISANKFNGAVRAIYTNPTTNIVDLVVTGNSVEDWASYGFELTTSGGGGAMSDVVITGNQIRDVGGTGLGGIRLIGAGLHGVTVSGNNIILDNGAGIGVIATTVTDVNISGNIIRADDSVGVSTQIGVKLDGGTRVTVGPNTFRNIATPLGGSGTWATTTIAGPWASYGPSPWSDVRAWGALGDGSHDDTTAIQSAVTFAVAQTSGGCVYFPPGQYKTTAGINVIVQNTVNPASGQTVTIKGAGLSSTTVGNSSGSFTVFTVKGEAPVTFEDMTIVAPASGTGIVLTNTTDANDGNPENKESHVSRVWFEGGQYGYHPKRARPSSVIDSEFHNQTLASVWVENLVNADHGGVRLSRCEFLDGTPTDCVLSTSGSLTMTGCHMLISCTGAVVHIKNTSAQAISEVFLTGNKIANANTSGSTALWLDFSGGSSSVGSVVVTGNYLDCERYGVRIDGGGGGTLSSATFAGNHVRTLRVGSTTGAAYFVRNGSGLYIGNGVCDVNYSGFNLVDITGTNFTQVRDLVDMRTVATTPYTGTSYSLTAMSNSGGLAFSTLQNWDNGSMVNVVNFTVGAATSFPTISGGASGQGIAFRVAGAWRALNDH